MRNGTKALIGLCLLPLLSAGLLAIVRDEPAPATVQETAAPSEKVALEPTRTRVTEEPRIDMAARRTEDLKRYEDLGLQEPAEREEDEESEPPKIDIRSGKTYALGQDIGESDANRAVVMNRKPVDDGILRFRRGVECRLDIGGTVTVIGKRALKNEENEEVLMYLMRYARPLMPEAMQVTSDPEDAEYLDNALHDCPTGTIFFMEDVSALEEPEKDARVKAADQLLDSEKP